MLTVLAALFGFVQLFLFKVAAQVTNVTKCIDENSLGMWPQCHVPISSGALTLTRCTTPWVIPPASPQRICTNHVGSVRVSLPLLLSHLSWSLTAPPTDRFLQAIPPGTSYWGPNATGYDPCGCSTAVYMLTSACGACQGRSWVEYTFWSKDCPTKMRYRIYPKEVPLGVTMPEWAKMNISNMARQTFDIQAAKMVALALPSSTSQGTSTSNPTSSTNTSPDTSPNTTPGSSITKKGTIAAIVLGGILLLTVDLHPPWHVLYQEARSLCTGPDDREVLPSHRYWTRGPTP
ncbi:hypothetical protein NMY22_g9465 [Coprinellus aureogranulatus]|nr:hypothetical protein NMY22_g9465 [Coprinellus aureogranulatus]